MSTTPWFLRSRRVRRVAALALVVDLGLGAFSAAMAVSASGTQSNPAATTTSSATTVKWSDGRTLDPTDKNQALFSDLTFTVSQTTDLTDQGLQVSWTGGKATTGSGAGANFLQIMQCWASPDSDGPTPEQCQWGTPNKAVADQTGTATSTRQLLTGDEADPQQDLGPNYTHAQFGRDPENVVPFWSIDDTAKKDLGWTNDAYNQPPFNAAQSNEVTYARTAADGTGQYIVNLQSALTSPYLGCGNQKLASAGYSCWLVAVPRGEFNLNGARAADHDQSLPQNETYVAGSPLSASAWQNRMQVKLKFSAIGANCSLGANEVPTAGSELVAGAFSSWQSALCASGTTLGYSQIGDGQARSALSGGFEGAPGLAYVTDPITTASSDTTIAYAPVTTSALVFSYLIDKNYNTSDTSNPDLGANGTLVTDLRLTPMLVAKLLTQSYRGDTPGNGANSAVSKDNPVSLRRDPEFLALNPQFAYFYNSSAPDGLIVPFGDTDAAKAVWAWLRSDSTVRKFLSGKTIDDVTVNPAYKDLDLDTDDTIASFPKADPSTFKAGSAPDTAPQFGTLDMRPYSSNFTDGARRTVTASSGSKTTWDFTKTPPQYVSDGAQTPGSRFEIAITTSQAASLYGLPVASLVDNEKDKTAGVGPTIAAMQAQLTRRVATSTAGVYAVDPDRDVDGGYPLTIQTYAAINVCASTLSQLKAYAALLSYAAGKGQASGTTLGQLPLGYAPLSSADMAEARATAKTLLAEVKKPACSTHVTKPTSPSSSTPSTATTTPATAQPGGVAVVVPPSTTDTVTAPAPADTVVLASAGTTPSANVSAAARYAILAALLFALPCLVAGPSLVAVSRRR